MASLSTQLVALTTKADNAAIRTGQRLLSPATFSIAVVCYFLVLFAMRGLLFPGGTNDDSEQLLFSQSFALGYGLRNPPLYTWLVILSEALLGVSLGAVVAVKFLLLACTYLTLFASALRMARDARWAVAAAAAPFGLYYVAWDAVQNYSHTVLLMFSCAATHHCVLRLAERPRIGWYGLLGLATGVGLVTKYNYLLFAVAMVGAALTDPGSRRALADRRIALTAVLAVAVAAPYACYAVATAGSPQTGIPAGSLPNAALPLGSALVTGVGRFLSFAAGFFAPLVYLLPLFFPYAFRPLPANRSGAAAAIRVTGRSLLIQAVLYPAVFVLAYAFGVGVPVLHPHLLFSFILAPLWFLTRASYVPPKSVSALPRFAVLLAILALIVPFVTIGKFAIDPQTTRRPVYNVPYPALAAALRQAGFASGTVLTWDQPFPLSGNLRAQLPASRFITGKFPFYDPPPRDEAGQCLALWTNDRSASNDEPVMTAFRSMTGEAAATEPEPSIIDLPMVSGWGRTITFKYRLLPAGVGTCH